MYARSVSITLKPSTAGEFTTVLANDILTLLRKRDGFADEITFLASNGEDALAISPWDRKESAEAYTRDTHRKLLKGPETVDGTPEVHACEVSNSTL